MSGVRGRDALLRARSVICLSAAACVACAADDESEADALSDAGSVRDAAGTEERPDGGPPDAGPPPEVARIPWRAAGVPPMGEVAAPALPATCPDGWSPAPLVDGLDVCTPFAEAELGDCGEHEAHFAGAEGCEVVGAACPEEPDAFPATAAVPENAAYVRLGADHGGDGSREAPFTSILDAVTLAPEGSTIVLGPGTYPALQLDEGEVTLRGTCAARTRIDGLSFGAEVDLTIRDLALGQGSFGAEGARFEADGVVFRGPVGFNSLAEATVRNSLAYGTVAPSAFTVLRQALTMERVRIRDTRRGVNVQPESAVTLRNVVMTDLDDVGLFVVPGSTVAVRGVGILRPTGLGVFANGADLDVADLLVREVRKTERGTFGLGLRLTESTGSFQRVVVDRAFDIGLWATRGTQLDVHDLIVRGTRPDPATGSFGRGLEVSDGSTVVGARWRVVNNHDTGMFVGDPGSRVTATDVTVSGTRPGPDGQRGRGVEVIRAGVLDLTRYALEDNSEVSLTTSSGTAVSLREGRIEGTRPRDTFPYFGLGLELYDGAQLAVRSSVLRDHRAAGVISYDPGTVLTMEDVLVEKVAVGLAPEGSGGDGAGGFGVLVSLGATARLHRVRVRDVERVGVYCDGGNCERLDDVLVERIRRDCPAPCEAPEGHGLAVSQLGVANVARFELLESRLCGFYAGTRDITVTLGEGAVRRNGIGACVAEGLDSSALFGGGVTFEENERRIAPSSDVFEPAPITGIGDGSDE
jgi:hypothetical protein